MKYPLNTLPFLSYSDAKKMWSIRLLTSYSEVHLILACRSYPCLQCYHRVRIKISCHKKLPAHQLRGWNQLCNLQGWKHYRQHPYHLQGWILQYHLAQIHIQIHEFKNLKIRGYLRFSKLSKMKRHHGNFNIDCAVNHTTVVPIAAPKQHITLLKTIYSNYCMHSTSTIIRVRKKP